MSSFIVIEGIEGSGKSTLLRGLQQALQQRGLEVLLSREPGATEVGAHIRSILLDAEPESLEAKTELFLFFADRAEHVAKVIRPALRTGTTVLCDRYSYSTLAYQGFGRGLDLKALKACNQFATGSLLPTTVLLLDLDPRIGLQRAQQRATVDTESWNRFEKEEIAFHQRIRDGFLSLSQEAECPWLVLDASQSSEAILEESIRHLTEVCEEFQTGDA